MSIHPINLAQNSIDNQPFSNETNDQIEENIESTKKIKKPKSFKCLKLDLKKLSSFRKNFFQIRRYLNAIFVRLAFVMISSYQIYLLSCLYKSKIIFLYFFFCIVIILDGIYIIWKRAGRDYYW